MIWLSLQRKTILMEDHPIHIVAQCNSSGILQLPRRNRNSYCGKGGRTDAFHGWNFMGQPCPLCTSHAWTIPRQTSPAGYMSSREPWSCSRTCVTGGGLPAVDLASRFNIKLKRFVFRFRDPITKVHPGLCLSSL